MPDDVTVRPAAADDLATLIAALGQPEYFRDRLARQAQGDGVVLVAWLDGAAVGDVYLWRTPADEPELRQQLPGVPLLNHLEVRPEQQNRGIGTRLVSAGEQAARDLGDTRIAIGVAIDNPGAHRLYLRLGYRDWGHGTVDTEYRQRLPNGGSRWIAETVHILAKPLSPRSVSAQS